MPKIRNYSIIQADCSGGCQNGGSCIGDGGVPKCLCQDGFSGDRCETGTGIPNSGRVSQIYILNSKRNAKLCYS